MFEGPGDQKGQGAKIGGHIGFQEPGEGGGGQGDMFS